MTAIPTDHWGQIQCPFPDCRELVWLSRTFTIGLEVDTKPEELTPDQANTEGWEVSCQAGHLFDLGNTADDSLADYDHAAVVALLGKIAKAVKP